VIRSLTEMNAKEHHENKKESREGDFHQTFQ